MVRERFLRCFLMYSGAGMAGEEGSDTELVMLLELEVNDTVVTETCSSNLGSSVTFEG